MKSLKQTKYKSKTICKYIFNQKFDKFRNFLEFICLNVCETTFFGLLNLTVARLNTSVR